MKNKLINSYEIETKYGMKSIQIYFGDITSLKKNFDILLFSAKHRAYKPTPGTLIESLNLKGINIEQLSKRPTIDLKNNFNIWLSNEVKNTNCNFQSVICMEFNRGSKELEKTFNSIFTILDLAEKSDIRLNSIAMPLLGSGYLNLPIEELLPIQLKVCEQCLKNIKSLSTIYLVEYNEKKSIQLNSALNEYLNRSENYIRNIFSDSYNHEVLKGLEENIITLIDLKKEKNVNYEVLDDFLNQLQKHSLRYFELCIYSRKFIETLLHEEIPNSDCKLVNLINDYSSQSKVSPWIISYMHVIRILGNNTIHCGNSIKDKIPNDIKVQDQRILLGCVYQVSLYWIEISK